MKTIIHHTLALLATAFVTGCASSAPKAKFTRPLPPGAQIAAGDNIAAQVTAAPGVPAQSDDCNRIAGKVSAKVSTLATAADRARRNYILAVNLTRYDKGNAFARGMLAGLGQIHIDGNATLYQLPERRVIAEFSASKTFAWGGAYGMSVQAEDIEDTFAEIIATAATGK